MGLGIKMLLALNNMYVKSTLVLLCNLIDQGVFHKD